MRSSIQQTGRVLIALITLAGVTLGIGGMPAAGLPAQSQPTVSVGDVSVNELNGTPGEAFRNAVVSFTLSEPASGTVRVDFVTVDGSAVGGDGEGSDYQSRESYALIRSGQTTGTRAVRVWGDSVPEPTETFEVVVTAISEGYGIGDGSGTVTIVDNDGYVPPPASGPVLSVADVSVAEGGGAVDVVVSLSEAADSDVTVELSTVDGSAVAGDDFVAVSGVVVTIPAGQVSASTQVSVVDDTVVEGDETFTVALANPTVASIGDGEATVTIVDDETAPPPRSTSRFGATT